MALTIKPPAAATVTYYTVCLQQAETAKFSSDVLYTVRRDFFTTGKRQKDKMFLTAQGESIRCFYTMDKNRPLKWKKEVDGRLCESAAMEGPAGYRIETRDYSDMIAKKSHFDNTHAWLSTEYIASGGSKTEFTLMPWTNERTAALALYKADEKTPVILMSVSMPEDKQLLSELTLSVQPEACAQTPQGLLYFCSSEKLARWQESLDEKAQAELINQPAPKAKKRTGGFFFDEQVLKENAENLNFDITKTTYVFGKESTEEKIKPATKAAKPRSPKKEAAKKADLTETSLPATKKTVRTPAKKTAEQNKSIIGKETKQTFAEEITPVKEPVKKPAPRKRAVDTVTADKIIELSAKEKCLYFGSVDEDGGRTGAGRTQTLNGKTLYDGEYARDMRDGFGAYYFKTGRLCYVGNWKENLRNGFGIAFRPTDGSVHIGVFENDHPKGIAARFDKNGNLIFAGNWNGGVKSGAGVTVEEDGSMLISGFAGDKQQDTATVLDSTGNVLYSGGIKNGVKEGSGILFDGAGGIVYSGAFKDNEFHGTGTLYLESGENIHGVFLNGKVNGRGTKHTSAGKLLYDGMWKDGLCEGDGTLYLDDGSSRTGSFTGGVPNGAFTCYSKDGTLTYKGTLQNGLYDGNGILYKDGEMVYDGSFACGKKSGMGRAYEDGVCTYMGTFENGVRCGFGIHCKDSEQLYSGFFRDGVYHGTGVLYENNTPKYAGSFQNGKPHGRINVIEDGAVISECLFESGACIYERRFRADKSLAFEGNIKNGKKEGMGCTFSAYGEKIFEGIFKFNEPFKSMKVITQKLLPLEYNDRLKHTDYEKLRTAPEYAVEAPLCGGVYSGGLQNALPHGKGTMLYTDHRYTGSFSSGRAFGGGVIYLGDGTEYKGKFISEKTPSSKEAVFAGVTYFYEEQ